MNIDGEFTLDERAFAQVEQGDTQATVVWSNPLGLASALPTDNYYRLRIRAFEADAFVNDQGLYDPSNIVCRGPGGVGEIEDHLLRALPPQAIIATKDVDSPTTQVDEFVEWTMTFENTAVVPMTSVNLIDWLPASVAYVPTTARLSRPNSSEAAVAVEPTVANGSILTWEDQDFGPAGTETDTIEVTILTRVGLAQPGVELVNQTQAFFGPISDYPLSNLATARTKVEVDEVFDCSTIIGRVFTDANANGYMDDNEVGIAGVSIYTARGTKITTDKYGRYHLPCGLTPDRSGQNFILKVNEQTIPGQCRVTSENPRVARLTAGKMTEVNFGVSCGRAVTVKLCDQVFVGSTTQPEPQWRSQLEALANAMKGNGVNVNVVYSSQQSRELASARLDRITTYLNAVAKAAKSSSVANGEISRVVEHCGTQTVVRTIQQTQQPIVVQNVVKQQVVRPTIVQQTQQVLIEQAPQGELCEVELPYMVQEMITYCDGLKALNVPAYANLQSGVVSVPVFNQYVMEVTNWKTRYQTIIRDQAQYSQAQLQEQYTYLTQWFQRIQAFKVTNSIY